MKLLWVFVFIGFALSRWVDSFRDLDGHVSSGLNSSISNEPLRVGLTLIEGAAAIGACIFLTFIFLNFPPLMFVSFM